MQSGSIATMLNQIEKNIAFSAAPTAELEEPVVEEPALVEEVKGKKKKVTKKKKTTVSKKAVSSVSVDQVCDTFMNQTNFFENAIVREQVFQLRTVQLMAQTEFDKMESRKAEIETQEKSSHKLRVYALTGFFTMQFLVGYHAIFNVAWLGWDLVEPLTFTIGQGSFIMGLILILRNRGANVEYSDLENLYMVNKRNRWLDKYNFDLKRYVFLKNKIEKIEEQLQLAFEQRFK